MVIGQNVSARKMFPLGRSPIGWTRLHLGGTTIPIVHYQFRRSDKDVTNLGEWRDVPTGFPEYSSPISLRSAFEAYYLGQTPFCRQGMYVQRRHLSKAEPSSPECPEGRYLGKVLRPLKPTIPSNF